MLQADAVAQKQTGYRPGARRALMVFLTAPDEDAARQKARHVIEKRHWLEGRIKRLRQLSDPDLIEDDILRSAAETALQNGDAIVVYKDEIRHDS